VTSVSGANKETYHLSAYALADGSKLWQKDFMNPSPQENSGYVSLAAPTPAADERGVVCFFEGGNLVALTPAGEPRWQRDLVAEYGPIVSRHGLSASLEQNDTLAFVWVERQDDPYVMAVSKETGEHVWKVSGIGATSWASPRLIKVADQQHLVLSGIGSLTGLDPATGERLWKLDSIAGNSTPTPSPAGDSRFLIGATTGQGASAGSNAAASNGLVEIRRGSDGAWTADYVWRAKRATSSFGSPITSSGAAYFVNRTGVLYALDLATGEERFAERLGDSIWATPVAVGEKILFFGKSGRTFVIAAGSTFSKVSENASWAQADPPPAAEGAAAGPPRASGGLVLYGVACTDAAIVLRSGSELVCVRGN
jgi:outer membrane protein assembly factor BamB